MYESTTGRFDPAAASRIRFFNAIAQPQQPSDDLLVLCAIKTSSLSRETLHGGRAMTSAAAAVIIIIFNIFRRDVPLAGRPRLRRPF